MKTLLRMLAVAGVSVVVSLPLTTRVARAQGTPSVQACLEANESAIKLRKDRKLRDTRAQLLICTQPSCPAEIRDECARRMPDVTAAVPSIIFVATNGAGADLADVSVTMDGQPFVARLDGAAIEVDPGEHNFKFESPGQPPTERKIVIREGEKNRRETITLGAAPPPPPPPNPNPNPSIEQPDKDKADRFPMTPLRIAGIAGAGVGVLALGIGTALGLSAQSQRNDAGCAEKNVCPSAAGAEKLKDAVNTATVATGFFVAGGVLAAAGLALFVFAPNPPAAEKSTPPATPPPPPPPTASVGIRMIGAAGAGLSLGGTW